jgi:high-affinity iron transporter
MIFNAILGWNNTATIGSIVSYCLYWILVAAYLIYAFLKQRRPTSSSDHKGKTWGIL